MVRYSQELKYLDSTCQVTFLQREQVLQFFFCIIVLHKSIIDGIDMQNTNRVKLKGSHFTYIADEYIFSQNERKQELR